MLIVVSLVALTPETKFLVHGELFGEELISKVPTFLSSDENPDVLLLGSSLVIGPAIECDRLLPDHQELPGGNTSHRYDKARFLENLLAKRAIENHSVYNLGLPGAMMSDQCILLEEALSAGKKPSIVILGVAPRDFLANDRPKPENTPVAKEVERLRIARSKDLTPDRIRQKFDVAVTKQNESWTHKMFGAKAILESKLFDILPWAPRKKQPASGPVANQCTDKRGRTRQAKINKQIDYYRVVYTPFQPSIFDKQVGYLRKALTIAREHSVAVLIVNMPLSAPIKSILDEKAEKQYNDTMKQLAEEFSVAYLDLGSADDQYPFDDFEDCVHLNRSGGLKFFHTLSSKLVEDPATAGKLRLCSSGSCN